ncbi:MAG: FIVAR domain-containing protein, partial [Bifidobacteriaceae bacterium]|nr:FIVAR domain-containing protein [Bifidobacteriaceae bacterium]
VEVPTLRQYTHLGDGYTETDNRVYDPTLAEDEVVGLRSGKQDDRLAMVGEKDPSLQFYGAYAMAAAATVLRGYDDELATKALTYAERVWDTEDVLMEVDLSQCAPEDFWCYFGQVGQIAAEFNTAVELTLATNGAPRYVNAVKELFEIVKAPMGFGASFASGGWKAALVLDYMDDEFKAEFKDAAIAYKQAYDASTAGNPFGVSDTVGMWGGSTDVVDMGMVMYYMHRLYPETFSSDYTLRAGTYILGTHADNSVSWLSGVGTKSVEHAYGNTRAEDTYVAGGIVPGYVPIMPDLPEAQSEFGMMWFESEYVIDTSAKWVFVGNAIDQLANEEPTAVQPPDQTKTVLANLVADVDAKVTAGTYSAGSVTPSSWAAFTKALADAKAVGASANPSAIEVTAAQAALTAAISGLTPRGDVAQLQALVDAASALAASPALSATTKVAIAAAITAGRATVAKGAEASQADVSTALSALSGAIGAAQFDKTTASANDDAAARDSLNALIAGLNAVPPGAYGDASYAAFKSALDSANAVLGDPNATSAQLRAELVKLSAAMATLSAQQQPPVTTPVPPTSTVKTVRAGTVKIKGTAKVGKKLTAAVAKWTKGTTYSYQWYAGSKKIKNATNKTFKIPKSLKGKKVRVKVTGTINGYVSKAKNSTATKKIK